MKIAIQSFSSSRVPPCVGLIYSGGQCERSITYPGFAVAAVGVNIFRTPEPRRAGIFQGGFGGLLIFAIQLTGGGLLLYGVVNLFS